MRRSPSHAARRASRPSRAEVLYRVPVGDHEAPVAAVPRGAAGFPTIPPIPPPQNPPVTDHPSVLARLLALLDQRQVPYRRLDHAPVFTSEEAARVRGTTLSSGAKALVCKADDQFLMFVLPADRRLDSKGLRQRHGWRSLRFASREEVLELTGLTPGSIPPFGSLFGLATWCDERLLDEAELNFNAGDHSVSLTLTSADFRRGEEPRVIRCAE